MSPEPHVLIVGCGAIAARHARTLRRFPRRCRFSFASRTPERAEAYRRRFGGQRAFGNLEAAWDNPDIDTVLLCTPHDTHAPLGRKALEAGRHLVVEKPLALTAGEGECLRACAREQQRFVTVAENYHYRPALRRLVGWIEAGWLGDVRLIRINKLHRRRRGVTGWRRDRSSMGPGAFMDGGIHWVNVLQTLGGPFNSVSARVLPGDTDGDLLETGLAVIADLSRGAVGQLNYAWTVDDASDAKWFGVYGTRGTAYVSHTFLAMYYRGHRGRRVWLAARDVMGFRAMWADFLDGLQTGAATRMTIGRGLDDVRFVEAAYAALPD